MVLEIATFSITPGSEDAFAAAFGRARSLPESTPGCRSVRMTRGIESPSTFVLLIEWDSVEAHEREFRQTDLFPRWRALIGPHFARPPHVEHYRDTADGDSTDAGIADAGITDAGIADAGIADGDVASGDIADGDVASG